LPKELFAAFRATLDELQEADILLHVVDISSGQFEDHIATVNKILAELDINDKPTIMVFNKADRLENKDLLETLCRRFNAIAVSAPDKSTLPALIEKIESHPLFRQQG
jgi:GTPase